MHYPPPVLFATDEHGKECLVPPVQLGPDVIAVYKVVAAALPAKRLKGTGRPWKLSYREYLS
jgi:hypothetical protein